MDDCRHPVTYYVNRVTDLPPLVAQAAFDAIGEKHAVPTSGSWSIAVGRAELRVTGRPRWPTAPYRVEAGVVRVKAQRMRVELELLPWSQDRTQLGLRPLRSIPNAVPTDRCIDAGHDLLDGLRDRMHAWADAPLRRLMSAPDRTGRRWSAVT